MLRTSHADGAMLPLALAGSLVLLLSSLSLQGMVLQGRHFQFLEQRRFQAEDRLASAAHLLLAQLEGPFSCLKPLPSSAWVRGFLPPECPPQLDPEPLRRMTVDGSPVELMRWDPTVQVPELLLQEAGGGLRRRFALHAGGLQELGV
jgi:hypothetical protein